MKNKLFLRVILFALTVAMVMSLMPLAFAEEESQLVADATVAIGGSQTVSLSRDDPYYMLKLNITQKADYVFWSEAGDNDPYLELLDKDGYILNYDDDRSYDLNFKLTHELDTGVYYLKVSNFDKSRKISFPVHVAKAVDPTKIEVELWHDTMNVGEANFLNVRYYPGNAFESRVVLSSSDTAVARINSDEIIGIKPGSAVITAKVEDNPSVAANVSVTVTGETIGTALSRTGTVNENTKSKSYVFTAPANRTYSFIVNADSPVALSAINASNSEDESVENDGEDVSVSKSLKKGEACAVTVTMMDSDANFTVSAMESQNASTATLVTKSGKTEFFAGDTDLLRMEYDELNSVCKTVEYSSSNENIARVNSYGTVSFLKAGTVTLTAKTTTPNFTKSITVNVKNPPEITTSKSYTTTVKVDNENYGSSGKGHLYFKAPAAGSYEFTVTNNKNINFRISSFEPFMEGDNTIQLWELAKGDEVILEYYTSASFFKGDVNITVSVKSVTKSTDVVIAEGSSFNGYVGQSIVLYPKTVPVNGWFNSVNWKSNDNKTAAAKLSNDGAMVDLLSEGTGSVSLTTEHGTKNISVKINPAKKIKLGTASVSYFNKNIIKDSYILTPDVSGFYNFNLQSTGYVYCSVERKMDGKWLVSDEKRGNIEMSTYLEAGYDYEVTLEPEFPSAYSCSIMTTLLPYPTSVYCPTGNLFVHVGDTLSLEEIGLDFAPYSAIDEQIVKITSANETVIKTGKLDSDSVLTALKKGTTQVTVETEYGLKTTFNVIVGDKPAPGAVLGLTLDTKSLTLTSGQSKTIRAVYTEGLVGHTTYWGSSDTKVVAVDNKGNITAKKAGTAIIYVMCDGLIAECVVTVNPTPVKDTTKIFKDVVAGKWYVNAINYSYTNGFIAGMSATEFGVGKDVTRGQFITILARIAGVDTSAAANNVQTKFTDVPRGKYYTAAIKWASEGGIVAGVTDKTFAPDKAIERQQLCVMILNFAISQNITFERVESEIKFADAGSIGNYAKQAVSVCQTADIVNGYSEKGKVYFKPSNTASRAEAAQILYKFHSEFVF